MKKIEQAVAVLTLTMGLCLMWEGYTDLSGAHYERLVLVLAGPMGSQKRAQAEFLKRRYMLPAFTADDLLKNSLSAPDKGFVLEEYPRTKGEVARLAALVAQRDLPPPIVIEIADRRVNDSPVNLDLIQAYYPEGDVWTFDGTRPVEAVSQTLQSLLEKTPGKR